MRVGETAILHAYEHPPGFSAGFPYHYDFSSDAPSVATIRGFASGSRWDRPDPLPGNGDVFVSAVAPGIAHVLTGVSPRATITVLPPLLPVEIHAQATRVLRGEQLVLTAVVPGYGQTPLFYWYRGRIGDYAHPAQASLQPTLTFIGGDPGVTYIWVQAFAGAVVSSAEIGIEVVQPRMRAARH
jgi:hypothetical protein